MGKYIGYDREETPLGGYHISERLDMINDMQHLRITFETQSKGFFTDVFLDIEKEINIRIDEYYNKKMKENVFSYTINSSYWNCASGFFHFTRVYKETSFSKEKRIQKENEEKRLNYIKRLENEKSHFLKELADIEEKLAEAKETK
jgi:hypothetical protein